MAWATRLVVWLEDRLAPEHEFESETEFGGFVREVAAGGKGGHRMLTVYRKGMIAGAVELGDDDDVEVVPLEEARRRFTPAGHERRARELEE
ncbi:MAG: hypothetical protein M3327_09760 [Actinomycetota bacterium]|nr:hypothetical protein [Actinomycetota bacterium]